RGAGRVRASLARRPELWNVQSSFEGGPPEMRIQLKRAVADGLWVDLPTIGAVIESSLERLRGSLLAGGEEERDVVLKLPRTDPKALLELPFRTSTGRRITIGEVADLVEVEGAREVFRRDQRRIAQVTARIAPGVSAPAARASALAAMAA